jgi:hypothetical protein
MNAFRTYQHIAPLSELTARFSIGKIRSNTLSILVEVDVASASDNALFTNLMLKGIQNGHLKVATVDRELRLVVAGEPAKRFSKNALTEAIEEYRLFR